MNIKSVVVGISALLFVASLSIAGVDPNAKAGKHFRTRDGHGDGIKKELNLTEEQKTQMQPLRQQMKEKVKAVKNDPNLSEEQKKAKIQELRKENQEAMNKILTPEQQKKMEQYKIADKGMLKPGHHKGPAAMKPGEIAEKMNKELALTDQQQAKVKEIMQSNRTKAEAIKADQSLSNEQKHEQIKALHKAGQAEIDKILTPEQREKAQQMRSKMVHRMGKNSKAQDSNSAK